MYCKTTVSKKKRGKLLYIEGNLYAGQTIKYFQDKAQNKTIRCKNSKKTFHILL